MTSDKPRDRSVSNTFTEWQGFFRRVVVVTLAVMSLRMLCFATTGGTLDVVSGAPLGSLRLIDFDFATLHYWGAPSVPSTDDTTFRSLIFGTYGPRSTFDAATGITVWVLASCLIYELVFGKRAAPGDGETRCRRCSYILRGLSAPRCPECGEPI
jgi:hypothetical protein